MFLSRRLDPLRLLPPARRHPLSRYRDYDAEALDLLALVKSAKLAGLSLDQIRRILAAARNGAACAQVIPLLDRKVREIDRAIRSLHQLRARLVRALKQRRSGRKTTGRSCPILMGLSGLPRRRHTVLS